ncbi:MAG: polysaccharide biosynthesis tyrosine autokinase [Burkholderiaceae bacterium]|nr:polysaccharide biosynthesis tyrosine autokinase [Burkholderiaceae bacterium]
MNKPFTPPPGSQNPNAFPAYDPYAMQAMMPPERSLADIARDATPEIVELWRGLMLRKWMILGIAALVTGITVFVLMRMTPIYRSTAVVLIEQSPSHVVGIDQVYGAITSNREYYTTQAEFLKSQDVALRVIRKLGLTTHPEFDPRQRRSPVWKQWLAGLAGQAEPKAASDSVIERRVLGTFGKRLSVAPVRNSQLVQVSFESEDPELAAAVANAIAAAYIDADMDARFSMTQQANIWLTGRLSELKTNLDASERALQAYREMHGIADTKGLAMGGQSKQIEELTQRLVEARIARTQAEESLKASRVDRYSAPAVIRDVAVASARQAEAAAEQKFAEIRQKYGPAFPTYKQAEQELEAARANSRRAADAVIASMDKEFRTAKAAEQALEDALARARGGVQQTNRKEIELSNYEREVETNRHLYETFLARVKETDVAGDIQTAVARVVDPALPGLVPIKPQKIQIGLLALIGSLAGASLLAILLNRMDNTIKTTDAVEEKLGVPLLGALPKLTKEQELKAPRLMLFEPQSAFSEAVRTVNTGVLLSSLDEPHKVIAITSSLPQEGKSTLATNLALTQSQTKRVLLIDGDLRRPVLAKRLRVPETTVGLTEFLTHAAGLDAIKPLEGSGLKVLVAGKLPPNPLELLSTDRFRETLATLRAQFDLIVIDCPPLQLVSDALVIGSNATGMIYVVEANKTPAPLVRKNIKRMREANVPLFGVALNGHDHARAERYYGDYTGYEKFGPEYYVTSR